MSPHFVHHPPSPPHPRTVEPSERAKSKRFMSRRPVIPRDCGLWSHGNRCCIGTTRTKRRCIGTKCTKLVASSPRSFRWSPKYMGSPHGLQSTWAHHDGLQNAKIVHMGRNVPKRWAQGDLSGRNGSSPPSLAAPRGRRPPDSPHKEQIAQRRRGDPSRPSAQRRTRRIPSAKSSGSAKCKRVGKPCSASTSRRTRRTAAPRVAAHRFRATFEGRDNITGRFVAPVENPFKMCAPPPCDATPWSLCAPPGSPESPVTHAAEAQILMETLVDPPPHARIPRVLDGANRFKADIFWCVLHRTLLRWNATTTVPTISLPTLLNPRWFDDSMRTLTLSLPLLNPISSCDSRQDEDGIHRDPSCPLNHKSKSARKREKQQAKKQERV